MQYTLNILGRLLDLSEPCVMGILNVTPDSFFAGSRRQTEEEIAQRTNEIVAQGGRIIDVGACSTRPGSQAVSEQEEMERLRRALTIVRREQPDAVVSVDTFRPDVARMAVEEYGAAIINDVGPSPTSLQAEGASGAMLPMFRMVSRLGVPYIYMSRKSNMYDVLTDFAQAVDTLRSLGQKDIVLDPGFGFGKTLQENYRLMAELERLEVMGLPLLVGVSRKSMIYKLLNSTPDGCLNGTTVLNTIALMKGASILRVHDVLQAVECIKLVKSLQL